MRFLKVYNMLNGGFYALYGLWGLLMPRRIAAILGFEEPGILGLHQIRALWCGTFAIGVIILLASRKLPDQRPLALCLIFVTLALATGRVFGMVIDGTGISQTYFETGFEAFWALLGYGLYRRAKAS